MSQKTVLAPSPPDPTASSSAQLPELGQPPLLHLGWGAGCLSLCLALLTPVQTREHMGLEGCESITIMEIKSH